MNFSECMERNSKVLMEGALGERLKREYGLLFDEQVAMAGLVYAKEGRTALKELWNGYLSIAKKYRVPFLATTPTRRANRERVEKSSFDASIIRDNVAFLRSVQQESDSIMYVGGLMGCKGMLILEKMRCQRKRHFDSTPGRQSCLHRPVRIF